MGQAYTTMSAIRPTSLLRRLVHLDVLDDQVPRVQALCVGVGFGILEQAEEKLGGFDGPAGFGDAELFACLFPNPTKTISFCCDLLHRKGSWCLSWAR